MRTTLTLDDDVLRLVQDAVHRERRSTKDVVNQALREALGPPAEARPYVVTPPRSDIEPGIDPGRLNQLADELEDEKLMKGLHR